MTLSFPVAGKRAGSVKTAEDHVLVFSHRISSPGRLKALGASARMLGVPAGWDVRPCRGPGPVRKVGTGVMTMAEGDGLLLAQPGREPYAGVSETHSAVVYFAGDRAFKLKKPVRLGFLDFSTAGARAAACQREVELNRRFANPRGTEISRPIWRRNL